MEFKSIEEIRDYYGIDSTDLKEVRKNLKGLLKEVHSDKTGGQFKSGRQKKEHQDISDAISFIDNHSTELSITNKQWISLQNEVNEFKKIKSEKEELKTEKIKNRFDQSTDTSTITFRKQFFSLKITSIVLTTVLSALWVFPTIATKHPILNELVNLNKTFYTIVWLSILVITAFIWIYTKNSEQKDKRIKQKYSRDSTHHEIFRYFLAWLRIGYPNQTNYNSEGRSHAYTFSKDNLYNFILNYYTRLSQKHYNLRNQSIFELYYKMKDDYEDRKDILDLSKSSEFFPKRIFFSLFKRPGELDEELSDKLSDLMINKLLNRGNIRKSDKGMFADSYIFVEE